MRWLTDYGSKSGGKSIEGALSVVAIPVCNEVERIGACLMALATQYGRRLDHVLLLVNNTDDDTIGRALALRGELPFRLHIAERNYAGAQANAGTARRDAFELAAEIVGDGGLLMTTDADGTVASDWYAQTCSAFARYDADAVCGRALIDPAEAAAIPVELHDDDAAEVAYGLLLEHLASIVDPEDCNPWPRHPECSGASIAVKVSAWRRAGGIPHVAVGEDRAFVQALRRVDVGVRHEPRVEVTVSGRVVGRAVGGMADTMARRIMVQDTMLDDSLESPERALRRYRARAAFRRIYLSSDAVSSAADALLSLTGISREVLEEAVAMSHYGQGWQSLELQAPRLKKRPLQRVLIKAVTRRAIIMVEALSRPTSANSSAIGSDASSAQNVDPVGFPPLVERESSS